MRLLVKVKAKGLELVPRRAFSWRRAMFSRRRRCLPTPRPNAKLQESERLKRMETEVLNRKPCSLKAFQDPGSLELQSLTIHFPQMPSSSSLWNPEDIVNKLRFDVHCILVETVMVEYSLLFTICRKTSKDNLW